MYHIEDMWVVFQEHENVAVPGPHALDSQSLIVLIQRDLDYSWV